MFSIFSSDPIKKLRKQYDVKLKEALHAQRNGNIRQYAMRTQEAQKIWSQIEDLEKL